jgi:hypothetical protein
MSFIYSYISYFLGWNNDDLKQHNECLNQPVRKPIISNEDLLKVKLNSVKDSINKESFTKNDTSSLIETFELSTGNNLATIEEILSVKLKPIPEKIKQTYYPPRNPVIRQMNQKFGIDN